MRPVFSVFTTTVLAIALMGCNAAGKSTKNLTINAVIDAAEKQGSKKGVDEYYAVAATHQGRSVKWEGTASYYDESSSVLTITMGSSTTSVPLIGKVATTRIAHVKLREKPVAAPKPGEKIIIEGKVGSRVIKSKGADQRVETTTFSTQPGGTLKEKSHDTDITQTRTVTVEVEEGQIASSTAPPAK